MRTVLRAILGGEEPAEASYDQQAGRLYTRQASKPGPITFVWVLSNASTAQH
ncbi:hypothetical protein ACWGJT_03230 [Streptomyces xantholiticus]